jgi:hypothetical protein
MFPQLAFLPLLGYKEAIGTLDGIKGAVDAHIPRMLLYGMLVMTLAPSRFTTVVTLTCTT